MAKQKISDEEKETVLKVKPQDAQAELEKLQARVQQLEAEKEQRANDVSDTGANYIRELQEIKKRGKSTAGQIQYKDIHDHRNIPLYHTNGYSIGKMVGPIHPENAEGVYQRFLEIGIKLSIHKPTAEQVERYKATSEFKKLEAEFLKRREAKSKSKKVSEVERLTKEIAKMAGVPADRLNSIRSPEEVGGRK